MTHYIDKDALVAEIEKKLDELYNFLPNTSKVENGTITISEACNTGKYTALESFRNYIDTLEVKTLEVKKVDWEKEWKEFLKDGDIGFKEVAKHFYELGLKAQKGESV